MTDYKQPFNVSVEQSKLLGSALRQKIISRLIDKPKTSKQVATELGHSPGNVHYHMKKLYEGGLIELVEEKQFGGVMEKYYQSKGKWFSSPSGEVADPVLRDGFKAKKSTMLNIRLELTPEETETLTEEFRVLLEKWVKETSVAKDGSGRTEFSVGVKIVSTEEEDERK